MVIKEQDVQRRIVYQNVMRAREPQDEEIAYSTFDGYEIATIYSKGGIKSSPFEQPKNDSIKTYLWFGKNRCEVLEEYTSIEKAKKGHNRWCQKEFV